MVPVVSIKTLFILPLFAVMTACSSSSNYQSQQQDKDIYAALKHDQIELHEETKEITKNSPEFLENGINEMRALYFRKNYDEAIDLSIRLLKLSPSLTEVYYWRARIAMDQSDFQMAFNMASKGLTYVEDPNMEAELERIKGQAQMGAK